MEYQKINLLDNTPDQPSKFRTKNWVGIIDDSREASTNSQIKSKASMIKSRLCDYSDAYILVKVAITVVGKGADVAARQRKKEIKEHI